MILLNPTRILGIAGLTFRFTDHRISPAQIHSEGRQTRRLLSSLGSLLVAGWAKVTHKSGYKWPTCGKCSHRDFLPKFFTVACSSSRACFPHPWAADCCSHLLERGVLVTCPCDEGWPLRTAQGSGLCSLWPLPSDLMRLWINSCPQRVKATLRGRIKATRKQTTPCFFLCLNNSNFDFLCSVKSKFYPSQSLAQY